MAETLGSLLRQARKALEEAGKPEAALDARLLVEHFADTSRTEAVLEPGRPVPSSRVEAVLAALDRRLAGAPVHRIIGHRDFHGMRLSLSPGTLEPRPDTETLVDLALPFARAFADGQGGCRILDLGTGTGAVALALLKEEPRAVATGTDICDDALATAALNADMTGSHGRFVTLRSDWFRGVQGRFHIIVSNPPYIETREIALLEREVRDHDPLAALDGGADGLDAYRAIAAGAAARLGEGGVVAVEIGCGQEDAVEAVFAGSDFRVVERARDLGGRTRALAFVL